MTDDVSLDAALDPLVLALDIGSTATRGGVHDGSGRRIRGLQHKVPHAFTVAPDGASVIDPEQVTAEVEQVLDVRGLPQRRGGEGGPDALFRGMVEGVALTYARVADELRPAAPQVVEVAASGRVSNDQPEWLQVLADVLGRPVTHVTRRRATQRGTALLALDVLAPDVDRAPRTTGVTYEPNPAHAAYYADRRARFADAYDTLAGAQARSSVPAV
ncbi:FGGY-family carbohydrate kinase [Paractinoplanes brasiliensis]|uniref:Carbohydrate kinase of FGGY family protein n=1 Tax=Paractinoplanes brasiliensis TaxID=52695 RepID=A0A4R6JBN5_9ACTN|nr:FGGY-family carbohydrate kinase [Actinoplanes brasiliensis]TDO33119.1 carbohydrate kinase of FGGY family protein [Actinoplanes brasiliensis]GID28837.1 hypothetical protein Abr02nite_38200 [Actinoplanes brasiliensis]